MQHKEILNEFIRRRDRLIVLTGQSASGKQTLGEYILEWGEFLYSETGALFRETIPNMSEWHQTRLKVKNDSGSRQPWVTATALWAKRVLYEYTGGSILIDGSPRSIGESGAMIDFFRDYMGLDIHVFEIKVSDEEANRRMIARNDAILAKGGTPREDTATAASREKKLAFYHSDVVPAINFLKDQGVPVCRLNGHESISRVREDFFQRIEFILQKED